MKLDPRIKSIDSIRGFNTNNYDCLGKFGYFTNFVTNLDDLNCIRKGICVFKYGGRFPFHVDSTESQKFQFFIPESELLPKKKWYRPFKDLEEFRRILGVRVGNIIHYREKGNSLEFKLMWTGYLSEDKVLFSCFHYSLTDLFERYEYCDSDGEWKPFGVEDES